MRSRWLVLAAWLAGSSLCQAQSAMEVLTEGTQRLFRGDLEGARQRFDRVLELAAREGDKRAEGGARRGLAAVHLKGADHAAARRELQLAVVLFRDVDDQLNAGRVLSDLGALEWSAGRREKAEDAYRQALAGFEAAGDEREQATALYNLAFILVPGDEELAFLHRGLDLSRRLGDKRLEGLLLHRWGDQQFVEGNAAAASEKLGRAAELLREANARAQLAKVLTSLGRLYRFHGRPRQAIACYEQALAIQRELGDRHGIVQTTDAVAIAFQAAGDATQARARFTLALDLARELKSPPVLARQLSHLAGSRLRDSDFAGALALLEEALRTTSTPGTEVYEQLASACLGLSRGEEALAAAEQAVSLARAGAAPGPELLSRALHARARAKAFLGRRTEAISDARESVRMVEALRSRLVNADDMRQDFLLQHRRQFALLIDLLHAEGLHAEALEVAETGRARAFLDLLASRELAEALPEDPAAPEDGPARPPERAGAGLLTVRGAGAGIPVATSASAPDLRALATARPFTAADIASAAARLRSTIISYWVGPRETYAWVTNPDGRLHAARIEVGEGRLQQLISPAPREASGALAGRGDQLSIEDVPRPDWRRLYDLLIQPVSPWLPTNPGSRVTVVPHGPLLALSFAALQDARGRYLLERHTLHYVPAAALLEFTARKKQAASALAPGYLLVADPAGLPAAPDGRPLRPLPGARREVAAIARQAPAGSVTTLEGGDAIEETVRARAAGKKVVHFATHAILDDENPFESFLALGRKGRLTAGEIYGLDLSADLVVLSACRTALGRQSGDGIIGLTRAFFYAGAPSVVATLWDVADEPTALLVSRFYRALGRDADKGRALRAAQLDVLRALRAGEVKVETPLGLARLPENPLFWAGFALLGEF